MHVQVLYLTALLDNGREPIDPKTRSAYFGIQNHPPRKSLADRIARRYPGKRQSRILDCPTAVAPTSTAGKAIRRGCLARPRRDSVSNALRKRTKRRLKLDMEKKRKGRNQATKRRMMAQQLRSSKAKHPQNKTRRGRLSSIR